MARGVIDRQIEEIARRCYSGLDATSLRLEVLRRLRTVLSVDAAFFATIDPTTMLFTSAVSEEPLIAAAPRFLDNEFGQADVNKFTDLAAQADPVFSLDMATRGERRTSPRYTEIMAPLSLGDELRVVLRSGDHCWGVMCLHREDSPLGFGQSEARVLSRLAPHLAEGLRRAMLLEPGARTSSDPMDPGIVVLDDQLSVLAMNPAAEHWLSEIAEADWPRATEVPLALYTAAAELDHLEDGSGPQRDTPRVRLRTATGKWLSIHASRLHGHDRRQTAVVLEPASPAELTSVLLSAHGLTRAQARVSELVLQGRSTHQIVNELRISGYTVQEHLTAVFDKFGVRSRRDLVASLLSRGH